MGYLDYAGLQHLWDKLKEKFAPKSHNHDDRYYTESEMDGKLNSKVNNNEAGANDLLSKLTTSWTATPTDNTYVIRQDTGGGNQFGRVKFSTIWNYIKGKADGTYQPKGSYAASGHTHDDRYYTEAEVDGKLSGKSNTDHTHDDRYYTESEIESKLSGKANSNHTHYSITTIADNRNTNTTPNDYNDTLIFQGLKFNDKINSPSSDTYSYLLGLRGWYDSSGGNSHELAFNNTGVYWRNGGTTSWNGWNRIYTDNYHPMADVANSVDWSKIQNKPSSYPPSSHSHNYAGSTSAGGAAISANALNPTVTLTGGDENVTGYRLIGQVSLYEWSNYRCVMLVNSRHQGAGLVTVTIGNNSSSITQANAYAEIKYWGPTSSGSVISSSSYQVYISSDGKIGYLFWQYYDYSPCVVRVLGSDFTISNGTWMTGIGSGYGKCVATTQINAASTANYLNYFKCTSSSNVGIDDTSANAIGYVNDISLLGQVDGALYKQVYSNAWAHEIYGDYRTGQIALRGKNNGTWQNWRTVLDSTNYSNYALPLTGGTMSGPLHISPGSANNYSEGVRIHSATDGWTTLMLCGTDNTGNNGTSAKSWSFHTKDGAFGLAKNGTGLDTNSISLTCKTDNVWRANDVPIFTTAGGTISGALNFANGTWNLVGDDAYMGDHNIGGSFCIMGANDTTRLALVNKDNQGDYALVEYGGGNLNFNKKLGANITGHADGDLSLGGGTLTGDIAFSNCGTGVRQIQFTCADNDFGRVAVGGTASNAGYMEIATADDGNEPIYVRQYSGVYASIVRSASLLDGNGNTSFPGAVTANTYYAPNWFRATGDSGFYFENHGGGWYMIDDTWIRAYNNKNIYTPGVIQCDSGFNGNLNGTATNAEYLGNDAAYMRMHWNGQGGQPTWLWGGNDPSNMYVWNPSNFSVNYANSAGNGVVASGYNYVRFGDGTQICWGQQDIGNAGTTITFAVAFSSIPAVVNSGTEDIDDVFFVRNITTTNFVADKIGWFSGNNTWIAIGRWK